jgi:hypothetical protein
MVARDPGNLSIIELWTDYESSLLIGTKNLCLRTPEERRANMGDDGGARTLWEVFVSRERCPGGAHDVFTI